MSTLTPKPTTKREPNTGPKEFAVKAKVAYIMSRFPKITETFILREMIELERLGHQVEVFPLRREKTKVIHTQAEPYVNRAHFTGLFSWAIFVSNLVTFIKNPLNYIFTILILLRANWGSRRYLSGAIAFFPKAVDFARKMKAMEIQHVHAHFASHPAMVAFVIHRFSGIRYSFTAHGSDLHRDQHMLKEKTRDAKFVVAISGHNQSMIVNACGQTVKNKVHVIHCGIDPKDFPARIEPTPFEKKQSPFRIVCIGTLHEVKGQTHLIDACKILADRGVEFSCHFLGDGPDEKQLKAQATSSAKSDSFFFHGRCNGQQVREHLKLTDVLVTPSVPSRDGRKEGIPVVLMEAMSCLVPCIASRISGIPELVENEKTGILTEPGDTTAIANAILRLAVDNNLRTSLAAAALTKVKTEFNLSQNTKTLATFFELPSQAGQK